jgi:hypothetical protein
MPPSLADEELLGQVLTIVDQQIRTAAKFYEVLEARVFPTVFPQLVIREKYEGSRFLRKLEPHPPLRMLNSVSLNGGVVYTKGTASQVLPGLYLRLEILE